MPTRKLYIQASFEQGMIDTVSFDYDYEDSDLKFQLPQNRGALLIENFDPSIVRGALTKRYGYGYVRSQDWNTDAGLITGGAPAAFNQTNVVNVDIDRYTLLIDSDPSLVDAQDKVTFLGATAVPYNKPIGQNVIVFFLRDIKQPAGNDPQTANEERTLVLHYAAHLQTESARWRNPHIDGLNTTGTIRGTLQPSVFPGWDISGTYTDHARHGGNLVITTDVAIDLTPNNAGNFDYTKQWVKNKMYPCYVWTYWDLRRKRSDNRKYWNVLGSSPYALSDLSPNYSTNDKYSQFKVVYPSMYPTRNSLVSFKAYKTNSVISDAKVLGTSFAAYLPNVLTDAPQAAVEIVAIEFKGREYSSAPPVHPKTTTYPVGPAPTEKLATLYTWTYGKEYATHIQTLEVLENVPIQSLATQRWEVQYRNQGGRGYITIFNVEIMRGEFYREGKIMGIPTKEIKVQNGNINADEESVKKSNYYVVGMQLPNYIDSKNPRPWIQGEKIPWVCTFKIRGNEVVAGKGVHTVERTIFPAYPSLWWIHNAHPENYATEWHLGHRPASESKWIIGSASDEAIKQQFALFKTQTTKINGNNYLVAMNRGYTWRYDAQGVFIIDGQQVSHKLPDPTQSQGVVSAAWHGYYPYPEHVPYCYEPFNPTTGTNYVADPAYSTDPNSNAFYEVDGRSDLPWFHWPMDIAQRFIPIGTVNTPAGIPNYYDANKAGYRRNHTEPNLIYFTIKIKLTEIPTLLELGVEAINFYVAEPGTESLFRSIGLQNVSDPLPGVYMQPATTEFEDYTKYRLVKSHVLDGDAEPLYNWDEINNWKDNYTGEPVATNCWLPLNNSIISVGQQKGNTPLNDTDASLTPDFLLWDYPATSTTLQLNASGKYWQGLGARCVTNIKGRTFLAGCIDRYGEEEQSIIRYSDIQSGVISLDIFSEENYLKVGGLPHTAILEYREQLWTFSRHECHRIQMPTIGDVSTWEYLDKIPGQGTFSPKTTITTPDGVFWCNESGVWLSDGRMPSNLAESVLTYYKAMATDTPPYYATQISLPRFPYNDDGFNPYMELSYDESRNELIVSSPIADMVTQPESGAQPIAQNIMQEYRLIFSFSSKTWRVEYIDLPAFGTPLNIFDTTGSTNF